MVNRKVLMVVILLSLVAALGFYLLNKTRTRETPVDRIYTQEKFTEEKESLIEGFPSVPVYEGLRLDKTYTREQEGKTDFVAVWYYDFGEEKIPEVMKWYIDEFKKAGWKVEGPFIDEGENELSITAENSKYFARLYNSERDEGDAGGPEGKIIVADIKEK